MSGKYARKDVLTEDENINRSMRKVVLYTTDRYDTRANQYNVVHPAAPLKCDAIRINDDAGRKHLRRHPRSAGRV